MDKYIFTYSESLVLSLCKEIEYIKVRSNNIKSSLRTCHNKTLSKRLNLELDKLNKNRLKILEISESMFNRNTQNLSFEFFLEISRRSNSFQQI